MVLHPLVGLGLLYEVSRSHSDTPNSVELLWTSYQSDADTSDNTKHSQKTNTRTPCGVRNRNPGKRAAVTYTKTSKIHFF